MEREYWLLGLRSGSAHCCARSPHGSAAESSRSHATPSCPSGTNKSLCALPRATACGWFPIRNDGNIFHKFCQVLGLQPMLLVVRSRMPCQPLPFQRQEIPVHLVNFSRYGIVTGSACTPVAFAETLDSGIPAVSGSFVLRCAERGLFLLSASHGGFLSLL